VRLIGTWVLDDSDKDALSDLGNVRLAFGEDGTLVYTVRGRDKDQIINLRYQVDGATIITDQLSAPRVERTEFSLSDDGVLTLAFGGVAHQFRRER
jgi:hypothetical protein